MPDFGIGELLAGLGSIFAGAAPEVGAATGLGVEMAGMGTAGVGETLAGAAGGIGAEAAGVGAGAGAGLADLAGASGTGLDVGAGVAPGASGIGDVAGAVAPAAIAGGEDVLGGMAPDLTNLAGASGTGLDTGAGIAPGATAAPGASVTPAAALQTMPGALPSGTAGPTSSPFAGASGTGADVSSITPAGSAGTAAPGSTGGGFTGALKTALPYMQAGGAIGSIASNVMGGMEASKASNIQMQALKDAESANTMRLAAAQPAADYGKAQLATATAGNLTASQQASLDTWTTNQKSAIHQKLANMGLLNSTMLAQWDAWVDQQALAQKQAMIDQTAQEGINAVGTASGAAPAGAQPVSAGTLTDSLASANQTLAQLAAQGT